MTFIDTAVTLIVLLSLFVLAYTRMTKKSLKEIILELRDAFKPDIEEVKL